MKDIFFNEKGGAIYVEVNSGYAHPGAYSVYLWEADSSEVIIKKTGSFTNNCPCRIGLPIPNSFNTGRIVVVLATLVITEPIKDYKLNVNFIQNDKIIGSYSSDGVARTYIVSHEIRFQLKCEEKLHE